MIKIYSTPNCHYCRKAKQYLSDKNIPFEEIIIDNSAKLEYVKAKTGQIGVPVFEIDGEWIVGWAEFMGFMAKNPYNIRAKTP